MVFQVHIDGSALTWRPRSHTSPGPVARQKLSCSCLRVHSPHSSPFNLNISNSLNISDSTDAGPCGSAAVVAFASGIQLWRWVSTGASSSLMPTTMHEAI